MFDRTRVRPGMDILGSDGDRVGTVKEVRTSDFLANRSMQRDIYIPFDSIMDVTGDTVRLNIPASQVDNMGWPSPSLTGSQNPPSTTSY